ncbi:MAG: DUF805 domain-containing protein [Pseudomonadota bacterium]
MENYGYVSAMRKYFQFSGRASRKEFWMFTLIFMIGSILLSIVDAMVLGAADGNGILSGLWSLAHFIPSISVAVRRLHDINRTGWWILSILVPALAVGAASGLMAAGLLPGSVVIIGIASVALIAVVILMLYFYCKRGDQGPNTYGADPYGMTNNAEAVFQ